ncbi:replication factor C subunit 2-like [Salvia splendens]|uniref:replication factor C subunit 2-like n=1 Tax=Salvia splendens TaxID=180675 RepID=UPI001C26E135|nr:replication factor C subunit 2-like [Salvia splendens]
MDGDVDLDHVAQMTEGFSGADLQALLSAQLKRCPRPKQVKDVAHQDEVVRVLTNTLETTNCPHMLFYGPPGTGKTTTDLAIAHQLYGPELYRSRVLELNASDDCGINVVRTKIKNFAAVAVGSERQGGYPCPPYKIIILDEADSMTEDAQASVLVLRVLMPCDALWRHTLKLQDSSSFVTTLADRDLGAARLFGSSISSKDLISVSGVIPDGIMQALFTACKSGDFDIADKEVKNVIAEGYPASQMLNHLFDVVVESDDIPDDQKARMCKKFGEADKCLVDGADEYLQLLDVASNIMRALNNRRIPFRKLGACSSVETSTFCPTTYTTMFHPLSNYVV